jgi:hypothetical protein
VSISSFESSPCKQPLFISQILSPPSAEFQLSSSISSESDNFNSDTDLQFFDASEMLINDRRFFIYNFGRETAEDEAAENGDFERNAAEDEAAENGDSGREAAEDEVLVSEDEVDGATVSYNICIKSTCGPALQQSRGSFASDSRIHKGVQICSHNTAIKTQR